MAGHNIWDPPTGGILGRFTFGDNDDSGLSGPALPNETPFAQAVREAWARRSQDTTEEPEYNAATGPRIDHKWQPALDQSAHQLFSPYPPIGSTYGSGNSSDLDASPETFGPRSLLNSEQAVPTSFRPLPGRVPGYPPVGPTVPDAQADHFIRGVQGLFDFLFRDRLPVGNPDAPGCKEEWEDARKFCADLLSKPNPPRGVSGPYEDVEDCARGNVSERCGGNPYERPKSRR
jgi:hypothetical protein